jgi:uncharacterized protein YdiU (UPF0061 family)
MYRVLSFGVVWLNEILTRFVLPGHPDRERCAVIVRVAESFLRFGSFEIAKLRDPQTGRAGPSPGNHKLVQQLAAYVQKHLFQLDSMDQVRFLRVCFAF